jgi:O-antigen ligase
VVLVPLLSYGSVLLARHCRVSPAIALSLLVLAIYGVYEFGAQSGFWDFHAVAETVFGDPTLTQRTDIWSFAIRKIAERPWLGYGYEVFWGAGANSPSVREGPGFVAQMPHAHNGYIDVVLQTGALGLVLLAVLILSALHVAGRLARRSPGLGISLSMLIFGL